MAKRLFQLDLSKVEVSTESIKREELDKVVLPEDEQEDTVYSELKDDGVDIAKDTAALEDISNQLETAIQVQSDLNEQLEANKSIENPTDENINASEVAIESAVAKLGISREDYGLHRSTKSFSVSQEGIRLVIEKIIKAIKDLIKKSIRFFKELFNKIRLKLSNYKPKIAELKEKLTTILNSNNDLLSDSSKYGRANQDIQELKLANTALFVSGPSGAKFPSFHVNSILACSALADWISICMESIISTKKGLFGSSPDWKGSIDKALKSAKFNNEEFSKNATYVVNSSFAGFYIGGSGEDTYWLEIEYSPKEHPDYPAITLYPAKISFSDIKNAFTNAISNPGAMVVSVIFAKLFKNIADWATSTSVKDFRSVAKYMVDIADAMSRRVDEGPKIFGEIENVQKKLDALTEKLSKSSDSISEDDNSTPGKTAEVARYIKSVSTDISGAITKVYFSTIRDYLVLGNVLIRNFGTK